METEFKWEANAARAFGRMTAALRAVVPQTNISTERRLDIQDVYLDHFPHTFEKQKIAFRIRNVNGVWEATFKTRTELKNGKAVRREETLSLPGISKLEEAVEFLNLKKRWKGLNVQDLRPLFSIHNKRKVKDLLYKDARAELAFDSCEITVAGRRVLMKEIEMEYKSGARISFEVLAEKLTQISQLSYAKISKVKTACALLKLWGEE